MIENNLDKMSRLFSMVRLSERSCNYARGRFDERKPSILSILLPLKVHSETKKYFVEVGCYLFLIATGMPTR